MRRLRHAGADAGTTLAEMLVAMVLFSIILAAVLTISIGFTRTNQETIQRQDQVDVGRVAVEGMSKSLRTAVLPSQLITNCTVTACTSDVAFLLGQDYAVRFYANLDNGDDKVGPSKVSYVLATSGSTSGTLTEKIQTPDNADPTKTGGYYTYCDAESASATTTCKKHLVTRVLARGVQWTTGKPVFAFYDDDGKRLDPSKSGGSLAADDLGDVIAVELTVTVQLKGGSTQVRPTTYISRVALPNAQSALHDREAQGS